MNKNFKKIFSLLAILSFILGITVIGGVKTEAFYINTVTKEFNGCTKSTTAGLLECKISSVSQYNDKSVATKGTVLVKESDKTYIGIKDCNFREYNPFSQATKTEFSVPNCSNIALIGRNIGTKFDPNDTDRLVEFISEPPTGGDTQVIKDGLNTYTAYKYNGEWYIVNPANGNYVIAPNPSVSASDKLVLTQTTASQLGDGKTDGATTEQAKILDAAKAKAAALEASSGGAIKCTKVYIDATNQPVFQCYRGAGNLVDENGNAIADKSCIAWRPSGVGNASTPDATKDLLNLGAGVSTKCVKAEEVAQIQALAANKVTALQSPASTPKDDNFFQWLFGVIIFFFYTILWLLNNGLILLTWLCAMIFVFFLRLNPAGALAGGNIVFELWKIVYGIANFALLVSFMFVGFQQILGFKSKRFNIGDFLTQLVVIALGLNFTILGAASVVNIAQGVGEVMIYSYVNVAQETANTENTPFNINTASEFYGASPAVQDQLKVTNALVGGYLRAIGSASSLHCSVKDKDQNCDLSKSPGLDTGNFSNVTDTLDDNLGEKGSTLAKELIFTALLIFSILTIGRLLFIGIRRFIALVFLMIGSPMILVGYFSQFGQLKKLAKGWLTEFIQYTLFYPVVVACLIIIGIFTKRIIFVLNGITDKTDSASLLSGFVDLRSLFSAIPAFAQTTASSNAGTNSFLSSFGGFIAALVAGLLLYFLANFLEKGYKDFTDGATDSLLNFAGLGFGRPKGYGAGSDDGDGGNGGGKTLPPGSPGGLSRLRNALNKQRSLPKIGLGGLVAGGGLLAAGAVAGAPAALAVGGGFLAAKLASQGVRGLRSKFNQANTVTDPTGKSKVIGGSGSINNAARVASQLNPDASRAQAGGQRVRLQSGGRSKANESLFSNMRKNLQDPNQTAESVAQTGKTLGVMADSRFGAERMVKNLGADQVASMLADPKYATAISASARTNLTAVLSKDKGRSVDEKEDRAANFLPSALKSYTASQSQLPQAQTIAPQSSSGGTSTNFSATKPSMGGGVVPNFASSGSQPSSSQSVVKAGLKPDMSETIIQPASASQAEKTSYQNAQGIFKQGSTNFGSTPSSQSSVQFKAPSASPAQTNNANAFTGGLKPIVNSTPAPQADISKMRFSDQSLSESEKRTKIAQLDEFLKPDSQSKPAVSGAVVSTNTKNTRPSLGSFATPSTSNSRTPTSYGQSTTKSTATPASSSGGGKAK